MRIIKFRAWDLETKKMINMSEMSWGAFWDECDQTYPKAPILMQFTGLLAKNGKEIFEGDILSRFQDTQRTVAEFKDGCFVSTIQLSSTIEPYEEILCNDLSTTEVIGNIYENPELLK